MLTDRSRFLKLKKGYKDMPLFHIDAGDSHTHSLTHTLALSHTYIYARRGRERERERETERVVDV
mgnify:CR=1 FL=1